MKCVCVTKCYIEGPSGRNQLFVRGDVAEFKICPDHFVSLDSEEYEFSFAKASETELLEATWSFSEAKDFVKIAYDRELKKTDKADIVKQILDARYRAVNPADVDHTRP